MINVSQISFVIGVLLTTSCISISKNEPTPSLGVNYLLFSVDLIGEISASTKDLSWTIGSTKGEINGWVDPSGLTVLKETISDGPGLLIVRYLLLDDEIILMHRKYIQEDNYSEFKYQINEQVQLFDKKELNQFYKFFYETNDTLESKSLALFDKPEIREENFTYEFTSKSCHALMIRFQHEHIFDLISDVEFQHAGYTLN